MSEIKRYEIIGCKFCSQCGLHEDPEGEYIEVEEYNKITKELEELSETFNLTSKQRDHFISMNKQLKDAVNDLAAFAESEGNDKNPDNQLEYARLFEKMTKASGYYND